jgi:hypothetical protein
MQLPSANQVAHALKRRTLNVKHDSAASQPVHFLTLGFP